MLNMVIYENYWSEQPKASTFIKDRVEAEWTIDGFATLSFTSYTLSPALLGLEEYNFVRIYEVETGKQDVEVFAGVLWEVIDTTTIDKETTEFTFRGEKRYMGDRDVVYGREAFNFPSEIFQQLLDDYNVKGEKRTVDFADPPYPITLGYELGAKYSDLLDEVANQLRMYWTVENGVVKMFETIGQDRTFGSNMVVLKYDRMQDSNIQMVKRTAQATRKNIVIGIGAEGEKRLEENMTEGTVYGAEVDSFSKGDLKEKVAARLLETNVRQIFLELIVNSNKNIFCNVGDKVLVDIQNTRKQDIKGEAIIIKKSSVWEYGRRKDSYTVGDGVVRPTTLAGLLTTMKRDIDKSKL